MTDLDTILNPSAPAAEAPAAPAPRAVAQGDTVLYTEYDDVTCERTHTRAAIVTCVWSASCVNLTVLDPDGSTRGITSVSRGAGHREWSERR